jgi:hypothetical protein
MSLLKDEGLKLFSLLFCDCNANVAEPKLLMLLLLRKSLGSVQQADVQGRRKLLLLLLLLLQTERWEGKPVASLRRVPLSVMT